MTNNPTLALGNPVIRTAEGVKWPTTVFIHRQTLKEMPLFCKQRSKVVAGHLKEIRHNAILEGINEECFAMSLRLATDLEHGC